MHHIQLQKQAPRLVNILTHNRSLIENDNPLNGPHFPWHELRELKTDFVLLMAAKLFTAKQKQLLKHMSCSCLSGLV